MRGLGSLALALVLSGMPLASACSWQRVESCRGPIGDFAGITNVRILSAREPRATPNTSVEVVVAADAPAMSGSTCVAVHAELHDAEDGIVDTLETPLQATVTGGVLRVSSIRFNHASSLTPMTVHVTLLGTTVDALVSDGDASVFTPDALVPRDAGLIVRDASDAVFDAWDASEASDAWDASLDDAGDTSS